MGRENASKGFALVGAVAIIVVVVTVILGGWYVWQKNKKTETVTQNNAAQQTTDTANTQSKQQVTDPSEELLTYRNDEAKITFQYPSDWKQKEGKTEYFENPHGLGQVTGTVTSPTGNVLEWTYAVWGGKGGGCTPAEQDVPFADGNKCSSKQIIRAEKLPPISGPKNKLLEGDLYITRTKYRPNTPGSKITYQICLDRVYSGDVGPEVGTRMDLLFPCEFWDTGFNAKFTVSDELAFNSDEAKTAESIMRSFNSL